MSDYRRTFDVLPYQEKRFGDRTCVAGRKSNDEGALWRSYTTSEARGRVDAMSQALLRLGTSSGEVVCVIGGNTPDWLFLDLAIQQVGAVTVPIYPTASDEDYGFILGETAARWCFVANPELAARVATLRPGLPKLTGVFILGANDRDDKDGDRWDDLVAAAAHDVGELTQRKEAISSDQLATIIFTSGTTGTPKGAMLTHENIVRNVAAITQTIRLRPGHRALSFLPLSHSFERLVAYGYLASGAPIYFVDDLDAIRDALREVKPHYFTAVPRLLEKQHEALVARGNALRGLKRRLLFSALRLGCAYDEHHPPSGIDGLILKLADWTVFRRWRDALGGCVELVLSGGAALDPTLIRLFNAAGMTVLEGYGMTEATTFVSVNRQEPEGRRIGTVGLPIPGVDIRIADDGEILIRGPNVMTGYYHRSDLTREAVDEDGWLHSGDLGRIGADGFLELSGRKKDLFKLSGGKYIAPEALENRFKQSPFIQYIMILGEHRKHVAALIVPEASALSKWCEERGLACTDLAQATALPEVIELFEGEVARCNQTLGKVEQVKRFALVPKEWTIKAGELSATMKVKRPVIGDRYGDLIERCYR